MAEVAVVGAGPVGMVLALELVRRGVAVTVLERREAPRHSSRSIGIHPPALALLERLGCADELIAAGVRVRGGEVRCRGARLGRLSFAGVSARHPFVLSVPQHVTERVLRERLAALAPDALVAGCEVTGARELDDGVELATGQGPVRAAWAVGADGAHSTMRRLGGFAMRELPYPDRYVMGDATDATGFGDRAVLFLEPEGVVESFPLPGGRRRWVVHRGRDAAPASREALAQAVRKRTGVEVDAASLGEPSAFGVRHVWAGNPCRGHVALVGDAAHEISPIGGQGMTLGWLDAAQLADALAQALGGDGATALERYRRAAARRHRRTAAQAAFNTAMGRPCHRTRLSARNLAIRGLTVPLFAPALARAFTMAPQSGLSAA